MLEFSILRDLATNINRNKIKEIEVLNDVSDESKRIVRLYTGLLSGRYATDEVAAQDLFGQNEDYPSYRRLRRKLFDLLVNTAFFIDTQQSKFTDIVRAQVHCYKGFSAANLLIIQGAVSAAVYLLRQVLEYSIKYEFVSLTSEIINTLRKAYVINQMDTKEIKRLVKLSAEYEEKRRLEYEASNIYEALMEGFMTGRISKQYINVTVKDNFDRFLGVAPQVNTSKFYFVTYNIGNIYYLHFHNMAKVLELCNHVIPQLQMRPTSARGQILQFALNALSCYTHLNIFNKPEVSSIIDLCKDSVTLGTANWIKANETIVHHYIYAERYDDALQLYVQTINHERFAISGRTMGEIWKMYAGYFYLLGQLGIMHPAEVKAAVGDVNVDTFEYDFKNLNTVKKGMNIPILMLPIYFKSMDGDMTAHGRSKESLKMYMYRHLKKHKNIRSAAMISLLLALDTLQFEPAGSKRLIKKHLKVFEDMPIELSEQSSAVEIVPYERLWKLILAHKRVRL
jgi:hypothetical protein